MNYKLREAKLSDKKFLIDVIIAAEKSGSDKVGLATVFQLTEVELRHYLDQMLEEEIDGCEFSISSFVVAEFDGEPVAAFGGWVENDNEYNQSSAILKSNLIGYVLPVEKLMNIRDNQKIINNVNISRNAFTHQLEYAYVDEKHRGNGLINLLIKELLKKAKNKNPNIKTSQVQVFENNVSAIKAYERAGYVKIKSVKSNNPEVLDYLPYNVKLLLEKKMI